MKALELQAGCAWVFFFLCGSRCYSACLSTMMNQADGDLQVYALNLGWGV